MVYKICGSRKISTLRIFFRKKNSRERQKEEFLSEKTENPELDCPDLEGFDFDMKENELLKLKKEILMEESNPVVKQAYRWRINEKIAELRMMKCTQEKNDKRFVRYSQFVYGKPEKEIFEYTFSKVKKVIQEKKEEKDYMIRSAAERLEKNIYLGDLNESTIDVKKYEIPEAKSTKGEIEYSAEEIKEVFAQALKQYEINGWEVITDNEGGSKGISVNQENKQIKIPSERKLKKTNLESLISHEIGTHVLRRENGERTKLHLLGLGFDRYLKGEEGVSTYEEQKIAGGNDFAGFDGHFAVSLALGMDGKKRNFREVFSILRDFYFISSKKKNKTEAWIAAKDSAWNRSVRTFRGTSCSTKGVCFTQDIVYREGNIGIWNVIRENPEEEKRFMVGEYDPANIRHIWILEQLGISEKDLEILEK